MDFCKGPFKVVCRYFPYSESSDADRASCSKGVGEEEAGMMRMPTLEISYNCATDRTHEAKWHAAHVLLRKTVCAGSKEFYIMYFTCRVLQMPWPHMPCRVCSIYRRTTLVQVARFRFMKPAVTLELFLELFFFLHFHRIGQ